MNKKRKWLVTILSIALLIIGLNLIVDFFPEQERELLREVRKAVQNTFPEQAAQIAQSYGLSSSSTFRTLSPSVVLIHGLDDPGKVWMNLAPVLADGGMNVWQMFYPNDQPILDSAWLLHNELQRLKQSGVNELTLVAHSMGGLVSREMLSNPQIAYAEKAGSGALPRVTGLIMVGTPNHGSEMARFRLFGEIREQWVNMVENRGHILLGILDGAGEARIDLLPGSQFLKALNARPHPENIRMLIIAGAVAPWDGHDINGFFGSNIEEATASDLAAVLKSMSDGLGDGLVTVDSTRLSGIEHRTVAGTHLSMIRNISKESSRVPPAVPLIIEFLEQQSADNAETHPAGFTESPSM